MSINIRKMEEKDIEEVSSIDRICFPNVKPPINYRAEYENKIAAYFVAEETDSSSIVAFGGYWRFYDEADIITIATLPDYRRQHIASNLLKDLLDSCIASGATYITLEVRASNTPAQKLYENFGFQVDGIRKKYYIDNQEDAVLMSIKLESNETSNA